jgi:hypothetical protein
MSNTIELLRSVLFDDMGYLPLIYLAIPFLFLSVVMTWWRFLKRPKKTFGSSYPKIGKAKFWTLMSLFWIVVVIAMMKPYIPQRGSSFNTGSAEIIVVLDRSFSMFARDWDDSDLSRLDLAIRDIINLNITNTIKEGDRVSLFVFARNSLRKLHPSKDIERFVQEVYSSGPPVTLTGDQLIWNSDLALTLEHIYGSLDSWDQFLADNESFRPVARPDRLIILFSDGDYGEERDSGYDERLDSAFAEINERKLRIYPVGIGTSRGVSLLSILTNYEKGRDYDQSTEDDLKGNITRLNKPSLSGIARRTGGKAFFIENESETSLSFLREVINGHRLVLPELIAQEERLELWRYVLIFGMFILIVAIKFY